MESIGYNLHPPLLRSLGMKKKLKLGGWFGIPLRLLAAMKFLRGTKLDPFGYARVRREERTLIAWYRDLVCECLDMEDQARARELAALPDQIRGYENIKLESIRKVKARAAELLKGAAVETTRV